MLQGFLLTLIGCITGISILTLSQIFIREPRIPSHLPLSLLLVSIVILVCPPLFTHPAPYYQPASIALGLASIMLLGPLLWLYIDALTSMHEWSISRRHCLHFAPAVLALGVAIGFITLPADTQRAMVLLSHMPEGAAPKVFGVLAWLLLLFWVPQSCYYLIRCGMQLVHHRKRIEQIFSNTGKRDMTWVLVLVAMLTVIWILAIAGTISSNISNTSIINAEGAAMMALLTVWALSLWGLNQKPAYEGHYQVNTEKENTAHPKKYSRSALDKESSLEIMQKIEHSMTTNKAYLNSDLTLTELAETIDIASNHVSQVLNETIGESFFDYVNRKRIDAATILLHETKKTALDIAFDVGFNARSSFYKSFKRYTGSTPAEYRKTAKTSDDKYSKILPRR